MLEYRRHLPHQIPIGFPIFLTWNLKGALPQEVVVRLQRERQQLRQEPPRKAETSRDRALRHGKLIFAKCDAYLDTCSGGPKHLSDPAAAKIVEDALLFGVPERYELFAWCVMANHVHLLLLPHWDLKKVTQGIKGFTARGINRLRETTGPFWQDETYDHWARDDEELLRIIAYIENNPVKAGLCERNEDWPRSSARRRSGWPVGQPFQADGETLKD